MRRSSICVQLKHYMIMGLGLTAYGLLVILTGNSSVCVVKVHTGFPCPGCGMTRAIIALFHGDFAAAFKWHPLWPLVFILPIAITVILRFETLKVRYFNKLLYLSLFIIIGVYVIRMLLLFPETAPMDFNMNAFPIKFLRYLFRF